MTTTKTSAAREWWASLPQAERDRLIMEAWPLPKPAYSPAIQDAFRAWVERRVYLDNGGNYRLRPEPATPTYSPRGKVAPWNREVKRMFANSGEFHKAAVKFTDETQANPVSGGGEKHE